MQQNSSRLGPLKLTNVRRKPSTKKHKTWDGDGILYVSGETARMYDVSGREMGVIQHPVPLFTGSKLHIAGKEIQIESSTTMQPCPAVQPFTGSAGKPTVRELDEQLRTNVKFNSQSTSQLGTEKIEWSGNEEEIQEETLVASRRKPHNAQLKAKFQNPIKNKVNDLKAGRSDPIPRYDSGAPDALVMSRVPRVPPGRRIVDIVVDPILSSCLRPHQRAGVRFMYDCVMGLKPQGINGCILADEMGLGKTLQVITLIWTLLKQNPIHGDPPVIKKVVIVCPATVIKNWKKEFRKWLGESRVGVFVLDGPKTRLKDFTHGRAYNVMIVGYEKLRTVQKDLEQCSAIDLVIADEGHRLKTANNKSAQAIKSLNTDRRIILSGTPLQNDLSEFYFAVDMVNPGLLSKANVFKKEFEAPIMRSRQPDATTKEMEKGNARASELAELTEIFMLRRTSEILAQFLPPKTETILFCRPTSVQASVYRTVLASPFFGTILHSPETAFKLIDTLKKLCNSPSLLKKKREAQVVPESETLASLLSEIPASLLKSPGASAKLQVLDSLLHQIRTTTEEKVVIVSHYTSTLDVIEELLDCLSYRHSRLDGRTPTSKRQGIVDQFNRNSADDCFAFLLSAKSGGAGINLIGASRLILFDVDWNPSTDEQAMARIHRDGQKRHCHIYRLLIQGGLDEKIFQRQVSKRALAESVVDGKVSASTFTTEELRRLFELDTSTGCQTHTLLGCQCEGKGSNSDDQLSKPVLSEEVSVPGEDRNGALSVDDESLPDLPTLVKASAVNMRTQEENIDLLKRGVGGRDQAEKQRMLALMHYRHLDPHILGQQTETYEPHVLDDEILLKALKDTEKIGYIFTKTRSA
ncbi:MAG: hypothetical protein Q9159_002132 [Coniocarpon cinnabarinum]